MKISSEKDIESIKEVICEVLSRLIGYTESTGDSAIDKIRAENNLALIYVTYQCIETLIENAKNKDSNLASEEKIGRDSYEALNNIIDMIIDS